MLSSPGPPTMRSSAFPPSILSLPGPPQILSGPPFPAMTSLPPLATITSRCRVPRMWFPWFVPVIVAVEPRHLGALANAGWGTATNVSSVAAAIAVPTDAVGVGTLGRNAACLRHARKHCVFITSLLRRPTGLAVGLALKGACAPTAVGSPQLLVPPLPA